LVVWACRRGVEVARELLGVVEDLEEDAHALAMLRKLPAPFYRSTRGVGSFIPWRSA
jgi:hypothetical protein